VTAVEPQPFTRTAAATSGRSDNERTMYG
jgi:hypothetical protein